MAPPSPRGCDLRRRAGTLGAGSVAERYRHLLGRRFADVPTRQLDARRELPRRLDDAGDEAGALAVALGGEVAHGGGRRLVVVAFRQLRCELVDAVDEAMAAGDLVADGGEEIVVVLELEPAQRRGAVDLDALDQLVDLEVDAGVRALPRRRPRPAVVMDRGVQGLAAVAGIVREDPRVDQRLGLDGAVLRPTAVLGERHLEALRGLGGGVRQQAHFGRLQMELFEQVDVVVAAGRQRRGADQLGVEVVLGALLGA